MKTGNNETSKYFKILQKTIENLDPPESEKSVIISPTRKIDNDLSSSLDRIRSTLEEEYKKWHLNKNSSLEDYVKKKIQTYAQQFRLPRAQEDMLVCRLAGEKGHHIRNITAGIDPDSIKRIKTAVNGTSVLEQTTNPIVMAIHDFSVDFLNNMPSAFVKNNSEETMKIKTELSVAIRKIKNSKNTDAVQILNKQMAKIQDLENIKTVVEGVVFRYQGKDYKLTGNFAPINQILGLMKFGRGKKIAPMRTIDEKQDALDRQPNAIADVAVVPGAFKPPHRGHLEMIKHYASLANKVVVFMSPLSRTLPDGREVTYDMSEQIWKLYLDSEGLSNRVVVAESPVNSPVASAYHFIANEEDFPDWAQPGETVLLGVSKKDSDGNRFDKNVQKYAKEGVKVLNGEKYAVDLDSQEYLDSNGKPLNSSEMRSSLGNGDENAVKEYIPQKLHQNLSDIINILGSTPVVVEAFFRMVEDAIEEVSAAGAGAIAASPQPPKKSKQPQSLIEEVFDYLLRTGAKEMKRSELIEEVRLRSYIRKTIQKINENKQNEKRQKLLDEQQLRCCIRGLIKEAKEKIPHRMTSINLLEDLLKKIIPVLEDEYKKLTSEKEQRKSFRAHTLHAVQNLLAPRKISKNAQPTDVVEEGKDEIEEDVEVEVGEAEVPSDLPASDLPDLDIDATEDKFISIDDTGISQPSQDADSLGADSGDRTGRNFAQKAFDKIEQQIADAYSMLDLDGDRETFFDYLMANFALHMDRFEDDLSAELPDIVTPEYQDAKQDKENISQKTP